MRRLFIIAGIGVILIAGAYLANQLFLAPAPPPTPTRPLVPQPQAKAPTPAPPQQVAPLPAAPTAPAAKAPTKAELPTEQAAPAPTTKLAGPATPAPPAKAVTSATPTAPTKTTTPEKVPPTPLKAEAKATAKPEVPKVATKPSPAQAGIYSLQVGAMVVEDNAKNLQQRLEGNGYQAIIRKGTAFVTKHVVTVGDPSGRIEAEELARHLNVDGFPSQLLATNGKYTPQIGAFFNLDEAIDLARELQKKNYRPKIGSNPANTVVFQVRHGQFDSRAAALKRGEELKARGFTFLVVRN